MSSVINIAIVGCGRILAAHLRGYRLLREAGFDDFRIVALCSRREADAWSYLRRGEGRPQRPAVSDIPGDPLGVADEYLSDFQDTAGVEVYTDYRQAVARAGVDAVNDYTIHSLHHEVAASAVSHRKHLLSQKPLGVTVRAARRMCEQAAAAGVTFGVFENARYRPAVQHARWAFDASCGGVAGKPQMVMVGNVGNWWAPDLVVAETPWRHRKILGGGLAIDLGVHQFHMIRAICGEIRSVQGNTAVIEPQRHIRDAAGGIRESIDCDADDTFFASFSGDGGFAGALLASCAGRGTRTVVGEGPVYYGTNGRVTGDRFHGPDGREQSLGALFRQHASTAQQEAAFPRGITDHFALTQHFWLQAIRDGGQPVLSGAEGLRDLACAYAILESDLAGRRVTVDEVLSGELDAYQKPIDRHFGIV